MGATESRDLLRDTPLAALGLNRRAWVNPTPHGLRIGKTDFAFLGAMEMEIFMQNLKKIPSFEKDHLNMQPGFSLSDTDGGGVSTFDLRFKRPNAGDFIAPGALHSIEHILATVLRSGERAADIVYFGPMGCRTGFYLLSRNLTEDGARALLILSLEEGLKLSSVPGSGMSECGNHLEHDLAGAKAEMRAYLSLLEAGA